VTLQTADGQKIDPDELAKRDLPRLESLLDGARDAVELFFEQTVLSAPPTVQGRVHALEACVPLLRGMRDRLARELYVDRLAQLLGVKSYQVHQMVRGARKSESEETRENVDANENALTRTVTARKLAPLAQKLLSLVAAHPALLQRIDVDLLRALQDEEVGTVLSEAKAKGIFDAHAVESAPPAIHRVLAEALVSEEFTTANPEKAFRAISTRLLLPRDRRILEQERTKAIERGDFEMAQTIIQIFASTRMQGETA
jgi:DNA primase